VSQSPRSAFVLLAFAIGVFVASFPLLVVALRDFGPATATFVRWIVAAGVLALAARGQLRLVHRSWPRIALIGALGIGLQSFLLAYAMTRVGGALPALVLGLEPIVIALVASIVLHEHIGTRLRVAFALGLAGEVVIAGMVTVGVGERPLLPLAALAGVVVLFSLYSVSLRQWAALPSAAVVCVAALGGAVAVLPLVVLEAVRGDAVQTLSPGPVAALLFTAVFASGFAALAWAGVLSRLPAAVAGLGLYLIPIGGALASHAGLGEPLYARHAVGALIVIAAVVLARSGRPTRWSHAPSEIGS
jgi:drug/metabolite transporter (DMT)-like permease